MFERFTDDARSAVTLAQQEARELDDAAIGSEHLLLGVLQSADIELTNALTGYGLTADGIRERLLAADPGRQDYDDDADALKTLGIDLDAVRDTVNRSFGAGAFDDAVRRSGRRPRRRGHTPFDRGAKKSMELALREALAHKSKTLDCRHLLLGILRAGDRQALTLVTERVPVATLRAEVTALLEAAA